MTSSPTYTRFGSIACRVILRRCQGVLLSGLVYGVLFGMLFNMPCAAAAEISIKSDSPASYTVVKGDTLWDIASRFLEQPWLWPQVWQVNPQIQNPDLIYPGDIIELAYENGSPVLRLSRTLAPSELRTVRLSPQVRKEQIASAVPAISLDRIGNYLSQNSVVSENVFTEAPYVLGEQEGRTLLNKGDSFYGRGPWSDGVLTYDIVRKGRELRDPDTDDVTGIEALQIGTATLDKINADKAILSVDSSNQEVRIGDRLIPRQSNAINTSFLPTPPAFQISAAIISIGQGNTIGAVNDTLILNVGSADRIEVGQLLVVRTPDKELKDSYGKATAMQKVKQAFGFDSSSTVAFPGEIIGSVLIYRVFENTSLALVLSSSDTIRLNDRVGTP